MGYQSGDNITTGSHNLIVGYNIDAPSATADDQLNIGNIIYGTSIDGTANTLSAGNIGIGVQAPISKLDVNGQITMKTGATNGYIPVSDANGTMTWTDPATITTATDADWAIDGSGNMSNANIGAVSIGVDATVNGVTVGKGGGNIASNTANGYQALYYNSTGNNNTANGYLALLNNTTG